MAKMYPENQTLRMNGVDVQWPGVDADGKFTNGDFNNPETPPSFIPAETINLLLDNIGGFIEELGATPNNREGNQVAQAFSAYMAQQAQSQGDAVSEETAAREAAINAEAAARSREICRNSRGAGLGFDFGNERWLTFDFSDENHRSLKINAGEKGVHICLDIKDPETGAKIEERWFDVDEDTSYNLNSVITAAANATETRHGQENGRNFYLYLVPDGEGTKLVLSCNSTFPNDISTEYTAYNTLQIGQFATLCVNAGSNLQGKIAETPSCGLVAGDTVLVKQYEDDGENGFHDFYKKSVISVTAGSQYDVVTVSHPLAGFLSGQILPESVFCLSFRPKCSPDGMVYDVDTDMVVDIYLQSGKGSATASEYNATVTDSRPQQNHQDDMRHVGKRLLNDHEFASMAAGSNEATAIKGASDPVTTGGHIDSAERRMISFIGIEDACGAWWQFLEEQGPAGGSGASVYDGSGAFGQTYGAIYAVLAGGAWSNASHCGSRARHGDNARSYVNTSIAGRGASRLLRRA